MRRKKEYFQHHEGEPAPVTVQVTRRAAFSDVDAMAVVWHGNYLRYFETAHTELMQKIGLTFQAYAEGNMAAPMVQVHADYHSPLLLDELAVIRAELYWNEGARLDVAYTVFGGDGRICVTGYSVQMFCDLKTHEPFIFPPDIVMKMRDRWQNGEFHA